MLISYPFRIEDNSGALVPGASLVIGATTLTPGTQATVSGKVLTTGNTLTAPVTFLDFGTGDYGLLYDAQANGEAYFAIGVSKSGSAITGSNALIAMTCSADSGGIAQTVANETTLLTRLPQSLLFDASGYVSSHAKVNDDKTGYSAAATNLPTDYQQRGVAVTLPTGEDSSIQSDVASALTAQGLTATRTAKLDNLDAAVSSRSTYAGGAVASVNGSVGSVTAPVTLPATVPAGYGADASVAAVKAQTDKFLFDANSFVKTNAMAVSDKVGYALTPAEEQAIATALLTLTNGVEPGETLQQFLRELRAVLVGTSAENNGTVTFNRKDGVTVALTVQHTPTGSRTASTVGTV